MAAVQSPPAIEAFRSVMSPLHRRAWDLDVDTTSLPELREQGRTRPLVFLPSHRSYADPLVLAALFFACTAFGAPYLLSYDTLGLTIAAVAAARALAGSAASAAIAI